MIKNVKNIKVIYDFNYKIFRRKIHEYSADKLIKKINILPKKKNSSYVALLMW